MQIEVTRSSQGSLAISWDRLSSGRQPLKLYLERAGSFTGPFVSIAGPIQDTSFYLDTAIERSAKYYYRLREEVDGVKAYYPDSGGVSNSPKDTLMMQAVREQFYWDLYYTKNLILLYPVKTFGQYCACYDSVRGKHNVKCLSCYGTKYVGGFFNPIILPARFSSLQEKESETDRSAKGVVGVQLPGLFSCHKGDILVDRQNDRLILESVAVVRFEGSVVKQNVYASRVPDDSIYRQLPVDLNLLDVPKSLLVERSS